MAKVWTEEAINRVFPIVFDRIASGEALITILESDRRIFPAANTFLEKISEDENLAKQYAHAREIAAFRDYSEIERIAKEPLLFTETKEGETDRGFYSEKKTIDNVQRSRLIIDSIKWKHAHTFKMLGNSNAEKNGKSFEGDLEEFYE